jgi:hypothetical protein
MLIDAAILREIVIFAFSVKRITFYPINSGQYGTEQLKLCCAFFYLRNADFQSTPSGEQ